MRASLVATLLLAGCASTATEPAEPVTGRYAIVGVDGGTVEITATQLSANAGCNGMGAEYTRDAEGRIAVGPVRQTKMYCEGRMEAENRVSDALRRTARIEREGEGAKLVDANGAVLLALEPAR